MEKKAVFAFGAQRCASRGPGSLCARAASGRLAHRPERTVALAQESKTAARMGVVVRTTGQVDRRSATSDALDARRALPVLEPFARHQPVGETQRLRTRRAAGAGDARQRDLARARELDQKEDHKRQRQHARVNEIAADEIGIGRRPHVAHLLGGRPGLVPFGAARDVKGDEQRRPSAEPADRWRRCSATRAARTCSIWSSARA